MSKTTLKRALAGFGEPELRQLILDVYTKSKDAKELLDFYAEPDLDKKLDEYEQLVDKEIYRYKRRAYRPRMSVVKGLIRRFRLFETGDEYVGRLMVHASAGLMRIGARDFLPSTVNNQAVKFFTDTIDYLRDHMMLDEYLPQLSKGVDEMATRLGIYRNPLKALMSLAIENIEKEASSNRECHGG